MYGLNTYVWCTYDVVRLHVSNMIMKTSFFLQFSSAVSILVTSLSSTSLPHLPKDISGVLFCFGGSYQPSTFTCTGLNCTPPVNIAHGGEQQGLPNCQENWTEVPHGQVCTPRCEEGFTPDVSNLPWDPVLRKVYLPCVWDIFCDTEIAASCGSHYTPKKTMGFGCVLEKNIQLTINMLTLNSWGISRNLFWPDLSHGCCQVQPESWLPTASRVWAPHVPSPPRAIGPGRSPSPTPSGPAPWNWTCRSLSSHIRCKGWKELLSFFFIQKCEEPEMIDVYSIIEKIRFGRKSGLWRST